MHRLLESHKTQTNVIQPSIMIDLKPTLFFTLISRDFKQEQVQIRLNLVVALAAAQLAFLSGIYALEPKVQRL